MLKIGTERMSNRTTNDIEARSLPQMIENVGSGVTKRRSIVCRSRSPLMAPAVRAGVMKASSATWNRIRNVNRVWP